MSDRIVIVGAGAAAVGAIRALRNHGGQRGRDAKIIVVTKEEFPYSRILLPHYVSGSRKKEDLRFVSDSFFQSNRITILTNCVAQAVNALDKVLVCNTCELQYDILLLCNGGRTFYPPIKGLDSTSANIMGFFSMSDADAILENCGQRKRFLILGGGPIGLDLADALLQRKEKVVVIEGATRLLPKQTNDEASRIVFEAFKTRGAEIYLGRSVVCCTRNGDGVVTSVELSDGTIVDADVVVVAAGMRPDRSILKSSLPTDEDLLLDNRLKLEERDIYVAGDASGMSGTWIEAAKQGHVAALNAVGIDVEYDRKQTAMNTVHYAGLRMMTVGNINDMEGIRTVYCNNGQDKAWYWFRNNVMTGTIQIGSLRHVGVLQHLISEQIPLDDTSELLQRGIFSPAELYGMNADAMQNRRNSFLNLFA